MVNHNSRVYYQLAVMREQLEEMRGGAADTRMLAQSAKTQAENTERLANAAAEQVRHLEAAVTFTRENIAMTQQTVRAWLIISKIERTSDFAPNAPITFNMTLKNVGPSTALNMTFDMADWICDGPPSLSCASRCPPPPAHHDQDGDTIVGPQVEPCIEINFSPQPQEVLTAIQSGTKIAYFCGTIKYKDVFNGHTDLASVASISRSSTNSHPALSATPTNDTIKKITKRCSVENLRSPAYI